MNPAAPALLRPEDVEQVDLWRVAVPLRAPFEASHGAEVVREVVVVRITAADGTVGHGECDALTHPTYTHEYARGAFLLLREEVVPAWLAGRGGVDRFHPMARAALATAQLDVILRRGGLGLARWLAATRTRVERCAVLGRAANVEQLLAAVDAAQRSGAHMVKLKLAGLEDLAQYHTVRNVHPRLMMAADANGSLDGVEPQELATAGLDRLGLRYLEQPYPADDLLASAALRRCCATPIALDESITSLAAARLALSVGALDAINIKPARLGGPLEAAAMARWAAGEGLAAYCGGMVELGIGRAAALAVAALDDFRWPTDLGPSSAYVALTDELCEPVTCDEEGRLIVPAGPGIGVDVAADRIERAARDHVTVRPQRRAAPRRSPRSGA